jgi:hypothetical protein
VYFVQGVYDSYRDRKLSGVFVPAFSLSATNAEVRCNRPGAFMSVRASAACRVLGMAIS